MSLRLNRALETVQSLALEGRVSKKITYLIILEFSIKGKIMFSSDQRLCSQTDFSINKLCHKLLKRLGKHLPSVRFSFKIMVLMILIQ